MKAIFCLPAHPSYFDDQYSQEEIEAALRRYDLFMGGRLFKGNSDPKVKQEFLLLREPGKSIQVIFDSSGMGEGKPVSEENKQIGLEQYRRTSDGDLKTHVHSLKETLKMNRMQDQG